MSNHTKPGFTAIVAERAAALHQHILSLPADGFKSDPKSLPAEIEKYAFENGVPMLFGPAKMAQARKALSAMERKPRVLVEFGAYVGYSALRWATLLEELNGSAEGVHVYTFELDPANARVAGDFVKASGRESLITVLEGPGDASLRKLVADGTIQPGSVDVVFIDHWEPRYLPDLQLSEELHILRVGSLVIADNTDMPGAPDYVAYVKKGGSGEPGAVRFETESLLADTSSEPRMQPRGQGGNGPFQGPPPGRNRPKIVEVTKVVSLGSA